MAARALVATVALVGSSLASEVFFDQMAVDIGRRAQRYAVHAGTGAAVAAQLWESPRAGGRTEQVPGDSEGAAMCAWTGRTCKVSGDWALGRAARLPDDSYLKRFITRSHDCSGLPDPDMCQDGPGCRWSQESGSCRAEGDLDDMVEDWYGDERTCGFLEEWHDAAKCLEKTPRKCMKKDECRLVAAIFPAPGSEPGSMCTRGPRCVPVQSNEEMASEVLCGKRFDLADAREGCRTQVQRANNTVTAESVACMRQACQPMGDVMEAELNASCSSRANREACVQAESCRPTADGGCRFDASATLLRTVPERCPVKEGLLATVACARGTSPENCTAGCQWVEEPGCDSSRQVVASGLCRLKDSELLRSIAVHSGDPQAEVLSELAAAGEACGAARSPENCQNTTTSQAQTGGGANTTGSATTTGNAAASEATTAPATTLPPTTLPPTTLPPTTLPPTTLPATTSPAATVPATTLPATTLPASTPPATTVPETTMPATTSPATQSAPANTVILP